MAVRGRGAFLRRYLRRFSVAGRRCLLSVTAAANLCNHRAHRHRLPFSAADVQHAAMFGGNFERGLVGFDLADQVIGVDPAAVCFQPFGNGHFRDRFPNCRNDDFMNRSAFRSGRRLICRGRFSLFLLGLFDCRLCAGFRFLRRPGRFRLRRAIVGSLGVDTGDWAAHGNRLTLLGQDLQFARLFGGNFERGFVGFDLADQIFSRHKIAVLLQPAGDDHFADRFANGGHFNFISHIGSYSTNDSLIDPICIVYKVWCSFQTVIGCWYWAFGCWYLPITNDQGPIKIR